MCKLNLPVQGVYDMLDCGLWFSHRVEHYKIAALYGKYEQNPIITADMDSIYTCIRLSIYLEI